MKGPHLKDGAREFHQILAQIQAAFFTHYPEHDDYIRPTFVDEHKKDASLMYLVCGNVKQVMFLFCAEVSL
jgi:hypothetical protein